MYQAPSYIWALALGAAIGIPGLAVLALARAAAPAGAARRTAALLAGGAAAWITASALLAHFGIYSHGARLAGPWFAIAFAGALGAALTATWLPSVRRGLAAAGALSRLAVPHTLRIEGAVFLIAWAQGHLPAVFALPAGLGDIAIGLSAPLVARRLARQPGAAGAIRFNILGIADLAVALAIGFLAGLGPVQVFHGAASTLPLAQLPLALIPTVAVPTAIALHVASLAQLRRRAAARQQPHPVAAAERVTATP